MKKLVYLPLDERPCNYSFVKFLMEDNQEIHLATPTFTELGNKKEPADYQRIAEFLSRECADADYLVIAIDTLLYGGIVPSRLHNLSVEEVRERLSVLKTLKEKNPSLKVYAFSLIMRCPSYSTSEEEPDYYGQVGAEIFLYGQNEHKYSLGLLTKTEYEQTKQALCVCEPYLSDYLDRRAVNLSVLMDVLRMTGKEIDEMVILQDDSNPYGFTAIDQKKVRDYIQELGIHVDIYPGGDEGGLSLLARTVCAIKGYSPKICPIYPLEESKLFIPLYEDREVYKSVEAQIRSAGGIVVDNAELADILLYCNAPACIAHNIDRPYSEQEDLRDLALFVSSMKDALCTGKNVAVADIAYCNGADVKMTERMAKSFDFMDLAGYAGWNTSSNAIGTVLAQSVVHYFYGKTSAHKRFTAERMYEDIGYCSYVRKRVWDYEVVPMGYSYEDTKVQRGEVSERIKMLLDEYMQENYPSMTERYQIVDCYMPWRRMFEVGLLIKEK